MSNPNETIRRFVGYLNNEDYLGGFWLPNIQRSFVWSEDQIEKLFDSILREYPIGGILVWKTNQEVKCRQFIGHFIEKYKTDLTGTYEKRNAKPKLLVLDGQQRLQSLYIGLKGTYFGKSLHINILSGTPTTPEEIRYEFRFLPGKPKFPWIELKELVFSDKLNSEIKDWVFQQADRTLEVHEEKLIESNIDKLRNAFVQKPVISYQIIDSIDRPSVYTTEDVLEIFIRANSGGTFLSKSDLMFSLLISSWDEGEEKMTELLEVLNKTGYEFTRDFILKTCLVLLDKGARYNVDKFRDVSMREQILNNWAQISAAIKQVKDFIYGSTYMKTDKTISSYLSLIPMVYFAYHYKSLWKNHFSDYQTYLIRTSLSGGFSGKPDELIDSLVRNINEQKAFKINEIFGVFRKSNRSLEITRDSLLSMNYWQKNIHLLFNLWYGFNYQPALDENKPQIDHIFPQSVLEKIKVINPETGKMNMMKYKWQDRDQIANLMLLTAKENGAGGKSDRLPEDWLDEKPEEYLDLHLIPKDRELWKLDNFEAFLEARKQLILAKFDYLISKEA
ncbi:MAG: DUF262 domain-containing protein [Chitinophagales bacterium]|nr:DUF262 domain-containing protein [Chitinophagales bacterium]